jgi:hypothetical protein
MSGLERDRPAPLFRDQRIARNLAIAEKFFDGYHRSVERGRLENVFVKEDFASEWVFCSPFLGGETHQKRNSDMAIGAAANHATIWQKIPDYKMDHFRAWPTESGCAWRWCVHGHGVDGRYYEFWEQLFIWTNDAGEIVRFEFFDDWHGFPQALIYAYGTSLDAFTKIEHYGAAPWNPGPSMAISPSTPPPFDPVANHRVQRNLQIAEKFFDGYHHAVARGRVDGVFSKEDFAEHWVLFSPWFGEIQSPAEWDYATLANIEHQKIWQRLPDYKMDHFEAWPTETGCAWRWCVNGHSAEGIRYEFWEQVFIETNEDGRITRFEFFDDWQGFPQALGFITGLSVDELWNAQNYREWVAR